jgi:copper homeostasis protein
MSPRLRKDRKLEIACFDVDSLVVADTAGADRTEFCADKASGGVTPPLDDLRGLKDKHSFKNPIHVMIRPRGGDFVYSDAEFQQMKLDIQKVKSMVGNIWNIPIFGVVFGILDAQSQVDVSRNSELVALAWPLSCTFHRAFDETADLDKALEDVIACGFNTILTSGGAADAAAGVEVLGRLVKAARERIIIMPGGGVRSSNIELLENKTYAKWYHSSAIVDGKGINAEEIQLLRQLLFTKDC